MRIARRHHTTFLLLLPAKKKKKKDTCFAETVSDTLSFSHVVREASQSFFLLSDSSTDLLAFIPLPFKMPDY